MVKLDMLHELNSVSKLLDTHHYIEARDKIHQLKQYDPISLRLTALEARYHLMLEKYDEAGSCLRHKWTPNYAAEGMEEVLAVYEDMWRQQGDEKTAERYRYMRQLLLYMGGDEPLQKEIFDLNGKIEERCAAYYSGESIDLLRELEEIFYTLSDVVGFSVIRKYLQMQNVDTLNADMEWINDLPNVTYIEERIAEKNARFVIVTEEHNVRRCMAIAKALRKMDKEVYLIDLPTEWQGEENESITDKSLENQKQDGYGVCVIPSYYIEIEGGQRPDNRAAIIGALIKQEASEELITVIASGSLQNDLEREPLLKKNFSRFFFDMGDIFESNFSAAWAGDYLTYIEKIYGCDTKSLINREPRYKYSIVILAQDGIETLQHTVQTCLSVDYPAEDYEIVICDNAQEKENLIRQWCQEYSDPRIKYCRTPRALSLTKHAEYAFLQAQGDFVFSIGEADGVLPWIFKELDRTREEHPDEDIIQWIRGIYAWPGLENGQGDQFIMPEVYEKSTCAYMEKLAQIKTLLNNPQSMYELPMLHLNSGFRGKYLLKLLKETGRLWDGMTNDIYMGVVNILINDRVLLLKQPLTILGMTGKRREALSVKSIGDFSPSMMERLLPVWEHDIANLYNSLLRAAARGILSDTYVWDLFDWKQMFYKCAERLDSRDAEFDRKINDARYAASWHGEKFLSWFDEKIYIPITTPARINVGGGKPAGDKKSYVERTLDDGSRIVDASKYGAANIDDTVKLFVRLVNGKEF